MSITFDDFQCLIINRFKLFPKLFARDKLWANVMFPDCLYFFSYHLACLRKAVLLK